MALPSDILGYLSYFIKPKKYTLIDKFCRDYYFRENGVSMQLIKDYKMTELYYKYSIKLYDSNLLHEQDIPYWITDNAILDRIFYIKCRINIRACRYNILREKFKKVVIFKCKIDSDGFKTNYSPLKGTFINVDWNYDSGNLDNPLNYKIIYNLYNDNPCYIKKLDNISNNIVIYSGDVSLIDLEKYPNIKKITSITEIDKNIDQILKHPKLKKIKYFYNIIPPKLYKPNGRIIIQKLNFWNNETETINSLEMYEKIKDITDTICVHDPEKIIEYEKKTTNKKKMELICQSNDIGKIRELLELFNLRINDTYYLGDFIYAFGNPRVKIVKWVSMSYIFKVNNNKLKVFSC